MEKRYSRGYAGSATRLSGASWTVLAGCHIASNTIQSKDPIPRLIASPAGEGDPAAAVEASALLRMQGSLGLWEHSVPGLLV